MYTTDMKAHQEDALGFNKNADLNKPLLMTGQGFVCFKPYLAEKRPPMNDGAGDGAYEIAVAFPEDCPAIKDIMSRTKTFLQENFEGERKIRKPFKKGDDYIESLLEDVDSDEKEEIESTYGKMRGHIYFTAKTKFPLNEEGSDPQLIDHNLAELDPEKIFGGDIVRLQIAPYAYRTAGNKGVAFGLRAVQRLKKSDWAFTAGGTDVASNFGSASSQDETESAADSFASKKSGKKADSAKKKAKEEPVEEEEVTGASLSDDDMFDED